MFSLSLEHLHEVLALRRVLLEGKFRYPPNDDCVAGSPFVAEICRTVFAHPIRGSGFELPIEDYPDELNVVHKLIVDSTARGSWWQKLEMAKKIEFINNLVVPFTASDETVSQAIRLGDLTHPEEIRFVDDEITNGHLMWINFVTLNPISRKLIVQLAMNDSRETPVRELVFDNVRDFHQTEQGRAPAICFEGVCVRTKGSVATCSFWTHVSHITFQANESFTVRILVGE